MESKFARYRRRKRLLTDVESVASERGSPSASTVSLVHSDDNENVSHNQCAPDFNFNESDLPLMAISQHEYAESVYSEISSVQESNSNDSDQESFGESISDDELCDGMNDAIFLGSSLTVKDSVLEVLNFITIHNLKWSLLNDLLFLLKLHSHPCNKIVPTKRVF